MNLRTFVKEFFSSIGVDPARLVGTMGTWSILAALRQQGRYDLLTKLRSIVPDISAQESGLVTDSPFIEIRRRALHTLQCEMMLDAIKDMADPTVIDIGDSAGTHMIYLSALSETRYGRPVETISVNLDQRAVVKIRAKGLRAIHCRAEDITTEQIMDRAGLLTSFEMVEHLHNPAIFFRRLAVRSPCDRMVISVPYVRQSRVGLHHIRHGMNRDQFAEDVHIFELSPSDWSLLLLHSGWRIKSSKVHFQYPRHWPVLSLALRVFWKNYDFEGFWCAILEKDRTFSDKYMDWED